MSASRPSVPNSSNSATQGPQGERLNADTLEQQAAAAAAVASSTATQELDRLYEKLSNASLSLKNLDPTTPVPADAPAAPPAQKEDVSLSAEGSRAAAALSPTNNDAVASQAAEKTPDGCDPECACHKVLLVASPGSCGLCGGRPQVLAKQNDEKLRALEDLEIATQRINELAHEKARHVDYIADLETRVSEQARAIDRQRDVVAGLKNDLSEMNDKFVDQVNMTAEIAHSRELVEAELEDLTQKLFTEANTMVAAEKKARHDAEKAAAHLRNIIGDLEVRLANETMQSQELKERIEKMSAEYDDLVLRRNMVPSRRGSFASHHSDAAEVLSLRREGSVSNVSGAMGGSGGSAIINAHGDGFRLGVHAAAVMAGTKAYTGQTSPGAPIRLDDVLFAEFKDFVNQTQANRLANYMTMSFIKNVITEDVEPCLRFGPRPRISVRNVLEAISTNRLLIEEMSPQTAAEMHRQQQAAERANGHRQAILWERFSGSVAYNPKGCQACGRECQCTYRFRIGTKADSEWIQIDTVCRDRLVAVCEFYGFVRYLRQGIFASRSVMDLYMETIRLRLCMFYARIGAYGYAIELDPSITEATLLTRTPGMPPQPDSPSTISHVPPFNSSSSTQQLSPLAGSASVPYINTQRAASAISVPWRESTSTSPSHLAIDSTESVNRSRSKSQEAPMVSSTITESMSSTFQSTMVTQETVSVLVTNTEEITVNNDDVSLDQNTGNVSSSRSSSISSVHSAVAEIEKMNSAGDTQVVPDVNKQGVDHSSDCQQHSDAADTKTVT
ncbi:hypothetical protein GGI07_005579 [Coemansia sp. Benny D115]|nr:hypothetical protein GGI07_005579 [Coemansia sp. Benny D115]